MDLKTQKCIASNIRYLRHVFGYNQTIVANAIHLNRCTYAQFESGERVPTADTLLDLSDFYNISIDAIFQLDTQKLINDVIFYDRCKKHLTILLDTYYRLSSQGQQELLQKAKALHEMEMQGQIPGYKMLPL